MAISKLIPLPNIDNITGDVVLIDPVFNISALPCSPAPTQHAPTTIRSHAEAFVNAMDSNQRHRFKRMLETGAKVGRSVADAYGIPVEQFTAEVKRII